MWCRGPSFTCPTTQEAKLTLRLFNNVFSVLGKLATADAKTLGIATVPTASQLAERVLLLYMVPLLEGVMEEVHKSDDPIAFLRVLQVRRCVACFGAASGAVWSAWLLVVAIAPQAVNAVC